MDQSTELDLRLNPLFAKAREGDVEAWKNALALMTNDLRIMAHKRFGSQLRGQTLQPTSLPGEIYLRLHDKPCDVPDRAHFLALCGRVMKNILIDRARHRMAEIHGGTLIRVPMSDGAFLEIKASSVDLDFYRDLERAVAELRRNDPTAADVFERRYWYGSTNEEVAENLKLPVRDARTYWESAKRQLREIWPKSAA